MEGSARLLQNLRAVYRILGLGHRCPPTSQLRWRTFPSSGWVAVGPRAGPGDDYDLPPTAHPGCELFTFNLFVLPIMTLAVWVGWKLISLI